MSRYFSARNDNNYEVSIITRFINLFIFTLISFAGGLTGYETDIVDFEDSCEPQFGMQFIFLFFFYRIKF